jgi:hypothetical protein
MERKHTIGHIANTDIKTRETYGHDDSLVKYNIDDNYFIFVLMSYLIYQ